MTEKTVSRNWASKREAKSRRLDRISKFLSSEKFVKEEDMVEVLESLIEPKDYVVL